MGWQAREAPRCPACQQAVYPAEHFMASDRRPYHKWCVRCVNCNVALTPRTINEHEEKLFCNNCYQLIYNPQMFNSFTFNGHISEEDRLKYERERQRQRQEQLEWQQQQQNAQQTQMTSSSSYQQQMAMAPSNGVDVQTLMTIAPTNQILSLGL